MKHINSFHGSITALLTRLGLDSKEVLNACNAYRGAVKASEAPEVTSETKLTGRINKNGDDKRTLSFTDKEKTVAKKVSYSAPGALIALSDELRRVTEKHGATIVLEEFPAEIADWLNRDTFKAKSEVKTEVPVPA